MRSPCTISGLAGLYCMISLPQRDFPNTQGRSFRVILGPVSERSIVDEPSAARKVAFACGWARGDRQARARSRIGHDRCDQIEISRRLSSLHSSSSAPRRSTSASPISLAMADICSRTSNIPGGRRAGSSARHATISSLSEAGMRELTLFGGVSLRSSPGLGIPCWA